MADTLLDLDRLSAGYGSARVLEDFTLELKAGRSMAVLGRNGAGKTTLLNSIIGVTTRFSGNVSLDGQTITKLSPEKRAHAGIGWCPQERNIFKSLTVHENLIAVQRPGRWQSDDIYQLFPRLAERKSNLGTQLSGGEQQMLAIGRALVLNPRLLLLDEPTEGLAPIIVEELLAALVRIFRDEGMAGMIVEQHARKILAVTDEAIILDRGRLVHKASSADLLTDQESLNRFLGVSVSKAS